MHFSVQHGLQNAPFRRVRFSLPGQTRHHLTQRRILAQPPHAKAHSGSSEDPRVRLSVRAYTECVFSYGMGCRMRFSVTSRRPGGVGQPPARLRGTMENASTGQMRSRNPPPACGAACARARRSRFGVWPHGKAHSARPVGSRMRFSVTTRPQNASFREGPCTECAFPHLGKRGVASRKSAFCNRGVTKKRTLRHPSRGAITQGAPFREERRHSRGTLGACRLLERTK